MLEKDPTKRITLEEVKVHPWVTCNGSRPLALKDSNCKLVTVTEDDVKSCVKQIPRLDTLILVKSMLKRKSFKNPSFNSSKGKPWWCHNCEFERGIRRGQSSVSSHGPVHLDLMILTVLQTVLSLWCQSKNLVFIFHWNIVNCIYRIII